MIRAAEFPFNLFQLPKKKKKKGKKPSAPCGTSFCLKTNGLFLYDPKLDQQKTINLLKSLEKEMSCGFWFPSSCLQELSLYCPGPDWGYLIFWHARTQRSNTQTERQRNTPSHLFCKLVRWCNCHSPASYDSFLPHPNPNPHPSQPHPPPITGAAMLSMHDKMGNGRVFFFYRRPVCQLALKS